jgi:hypothetical protein
MGYVRNNYACVECTQLTGIWDPLHEIWKKNIKVRLKHFYHLSCQRFMKTDKEYVIHVGTFSWNHMLYFSFQINVLEQGSENRQSHLKRQY